MTSPQRTTKAPPFSQEKPALWFAELEALLRNFCIITETDKYYARIPLLDTKVASEIEDLIISVPTGTPYQKIKDTLISCISKSRTANLLRLHDAESIGDRTPSQHLRHLKGLVPDIDEKVLKTSWFSHLPELTRACLVVQDESPVVDLAKLADRLHEVYSTGTVAAVSIAGGAEVAQLSAQIAQLTAEVAVLKAQHSPHSSRGRSKSRSYSRSRSNTDNSPKLCFYHQRFSDRVRNCEPGSQTFQRLIDEVTRDLLFVFPYIDGILGASETPEQHLGHLQVLFQRLQDFGLVINVTKSVLCKPEVIFLGHAINAQGIRPSQKRVRDLLEFPKPNTERQRSYAL
ncbi:uncharacterized protein LOC107045409 [Diachasma alloeum]|uniref:uncharacterized protein LOC107045409 n=1 Tax=Diachasma alloeum TaxID=454923 RepID=UPI000738206F|nr:uncharacterized protein LOC107045409 [Diachasma alloeum]